MQTTKLSSKGQIIIPKSLRVRHKWSVGQKLVVIDTDHGILLKSTSPFEPTDLKRVAGCLKYEGKPVSLDDMENAIKAGAIERGK